MTRGFVPICTILAGPNGAGKSTIVQDLAPPGESVNADDYARRINPQEPSLASSAAGREVLGRISRLLLDRQSFNFETTLSSLYSLELMARARKVGFRVELLFVILRSPELHVARVRSRVATGGHDIPTATIVRRYGRSLAHLPEAISLADEVIIYDNTAARPVALCRIDGKAVTSSELQRLDLFHAQLGRLIAGGLGVPVEAVWRSAT